MSRDLSFRAARYDSFSLRYRPDLSGLALLKPETFSTLTLAIVATALPLVFHLAGQGFGLAVCVGLAFLIATFAPATVISVLIFSYLFQNLFVSILSPAIDDLGQFNSIRAYNFVLTVVIWAAIVSRYWLADRALEPKLRSIVNATTVVLVLIGIYFIVGVVRGGAGAAIYLRNIATPFLLFQISLLVAFQHRLSIAGSLRAMAAVALVYGYLELFAHDGLWRLINGYNYLELRTRQDYEAGAWLKELTETGRVIRTVLDTMLIDFLNTPLLKEFGFQFYRILGPNFHSISFGYGLAFFAIVLITIGRWRFALFTVPLMLVLGSKGALILVTLVTLVFIGVRSLRSGPMLWILSAALTMYACFGVLIGLIFQDYHVIGFIGGLRGFLQNPLGHGIGLGGNLSMDMTTIDWNKSQHLGHTDIAVESAVGVLLYQMGIMGALLLLVLIWIALKLWKLHAQKGNRAAAAVAAALLTVTVNGIFQEEAMFSPLALGVIVALAGLMLGKDYRRTLEKQSIARQGAARPDN